MALIAYNLTGAPVVLAAAILSPAPTLPASDSPPSRGDGINVTSEIKASLVVDAANGVAGGLSAANYASIQAQIAANDIELEWTHNPEYLTTGMTPTTTGFPHAADHAAAGTDPLTVDNETTIQDAHNHAVTDGGHTHTHVTHAHAVSDVGHTHTHVTHAHAVSDVGHTHTHVTHAHAVTDGGHTHTHVAHNHAVTDGGHTHTHNALVLAGVARYVNPIAAELISVVAVLDPIVDGVLSLVTQPDYPRKLQINIIDANASISAGTVDLVGVGADGGALAESIAISGGTATTTTANAYATLTSATVVGQVGAVAGDSISIGLGAALGLPIPAGAANVSVNKTVVDSADEVVAGVDATARSVAPTSVPNAALDYDFFYSYELTTTESSQVTGLTVDNNTATESSQTTGLTVDTIVSTENSQTTGLTVDTIVSTENSQTTGATVDTVVSTESSQTTGATVDNATATNTAHNHALSG